MVYGITAQNSQSFRVSEYPLRVAPGAPCDPSAHLWDPEQLRPEMPRKDEKNDPKEKKKKKKDPNPPHSPPHRKSGRTQHHSATRSSFKAGLVPASQLRADFVVVPQARSTDDPAPPTLATGTK